MQYQSECRNALESVVNISKSFQKVVTILFSALTRMFPKPTFAP